MLKIAMDGEASAEEEIGEGQARGGKSADGVAAPRPPTRPSSAPPARGRRPQLNNTNISNNNENNQEETAPSPAGAAAARGAVARTGNAGDGEQGEGDDDSFGKDSHDLGGFEELEGEEAEAFSYEDYPAAGSPEEPEWIHVPWCGTNSGDIPVLDKIVEKTPDGGKAPAPPAQQPPPLSASDPAAPSPISPRGRIGSITAIGDEGDAGDGVGNGSVGDPARNSRPRPVPHSGGGSAKHGVANEVLSAARGAGDDELAGGAPASPLRLPGGGQGATGGRSAAAGSPGVTGRRVSSPRAIAGGRELKRYDWGGAEVMPAKPSLLTTSRIPMGSNADKQRLRNAKRRDANRKVGEAGVVFGAANESGCRGRRTPSYPVEAACGPSPPAVVAVSSSQKIFVPLHASFGRC